MYFHSHFPSSFHSPQRTPLHARLEYEAVDDTAEKDVTLISLHAGLGNSPPRKGHARGERFPPFSNLVGMEIERALGKLHNKSELSFAPEKAKGSRQPNDKSLLFTELELLLGCDVRSEGKPPWDTCTSMAHNTTQFTGFSNKFAPRQSNQPCHSYVPRSASKNATVSCLYGIKTMQ